MIATSNIYMNIRITDLSEILLIDVARTEKVRKTVRFVLSLFSLLVVHVTGCSCYDI
jgi:hypothetical protein